MDELQPIGGRTQKDIKNYLIRTKKMRSIIDSFSGEFHFLSNFFPAEIQYDGIYYITNEHAFQAAKSLDFAERMLVANAPSAGKAKLMGRTLKLRADWENIKISIMREICAIKFLSYDSLRKKLVETREISLVEGNTWNDKFWGVCDGEGENWLGKILMELRSKLK
jgi:ribA/ribD-fused uncharacterized protein